MMKDRAISEREPAYKELISGHSEHQGEMTSTLDPLFNIQTNTDPYDDPSYNQPPGLISNQKNESTPIKTRLREAPATRFNGQQHVFDLLELSAHLLTEAHPGEHGHRQMTIFRHDGTTMVLFAFEAGGKLADHKANGLVTIYALDGTLTIEAQIETGDGGDVRWQTHSLRAQGMLVLGPGVTHNVTAMEASRMLLFVHMEKGVVPAPQAKTQPQAGKGRYSFSGSDKVSLLRGSD